jgi:hypothetical protein
VVDRRLTMLNKQVMTAAPLKKQEKHGVLLLFFEPIMMMDDDRNKRLQKWWPITKSLRVCKLVPAVCCDEKLISRLKFSLTAGAKMERDVMGVGGWVLGMLSMACVAVGVYLEHEYYSNNQNRRVIIKDNKTIANNNNNITGNKTPSSRATNMIQHAMTYFSGTNSFTFTYPVVTYKIFVALLMAMELNFYTAPETTFMATPELVQLWRKKTRFDRICTALD